MENKQVFKESQELSRLAVQNKLLEKYEQPIYERILASYDHIRVLDLGCNNGSKTVERFTRANIEQVIGLEYYADLAMQAQEEHGNEVFAFYPCDVEEAGFEERLAALMEQNRVEAFDIIHLSFVLMHLQEPDELLRKLKKVLAPGGRLIVVEANDAVSALSPDPEQLWDQFLDILSLEPFSGNRACGEEVPLFLSQTGYQQIVLENSVIEASAAERQQKEDMFITFCTYLPEDIDILRQTHPDNTLCKEWVSWVEQHFEALRHQILMENTTFTAGISIITCFGA